MFKGAMDFRCRESEISINIKEDTPFLCGNIECPEKYLFISIK